VEAFVLEAIAQIRPVRARSRVGAGDCMVAGIVLALERGAELDDACALGVAAGTAAVMSDGTELCRLADVERLRSQVGHARSEANK
jgi:6-phosphofructokinase 2